jgi:peptide-methionine (R)-S-oxide reductase
MSNHSDSKPSTDPKALKQRLSDIQYQVTQEAATERPFSGEFWDHFKDGVYRCVCCDKALFSSNTKFDAGCGWPSFYDELKDSEIKTVEDNSLGMQRIEIRCGHCDSHLGHVFPDGPTPTGNRYCVNSASLSFDASPDDNPEESCE